MSMVSTARGEVGVGCSLGAPFASSSRPCRPALAPRGAVGKGRERACGSGVHRARGQRLVASAAAEEEQGVEEVASIDVAASAAVDGDGEGSLTESEAEDEIDAFLDGSNLDEQGEPSAVTKVIVNPVRSLQHRPLLRGAALLVSAYLLGTFSWAAFKTVRKRVSPNAKRRRKVNKNRLVIDEINAFLPGRAEALTPEEMQRIQSLTGFTGDLVFRKYLRYLLVERQFGAETVGDVLALHAALGLGEEETKEIFRQVAQSTFKKYGILMTDTTGLTSSAITQKATERGIFAKLLYLADLPALFPSLSVAAAEAEGEGGADLTQSLRWQISEIFGATEEDCDKLRIETLSELDEGGMEELFTKE